ncbi:hypothetical protein BN1110_03981 [bacterium YEK0313]|nr:hypothetical protein BN1110_03981 [bacterium YEK0313]
MRMSPLLLILPLLAASTAAAFAQGTADLPSRRPGLWEEAVIDPQRPSAVPADIFRICVDAATDRLSMLVPENIPLQDCRERSLQRDSTRRIVTVVCGRPPSETIVTTVISGDYPARYVVDRELGMVSSGRSIRPFGNGRRSEGRWISQSCGDGLVPGDVVTPSGRKIHRNGAPLTPSAHPPGGR